MATKELSAVDNTTKSTPPTTPSKGPVSSTTKEPRSNSPQQAEVFRQETNKMIIVFIEEIHSFDHYKVEAAYKYLIHKYLNQLLITDNVYYNKKAVRLMAWLIKFYKFYYLLYLNKRWLNSQ